MGTKLSPVREQWPILKDFDLMTAFELMGRGKIRDMYLLPDRKHLLIVATDGISIFDFVLNALVRYKGEVLTAMTIFWNQILAQYFNTHLVAFGADIDAYLPDSLRGDPDLQRRAMVVKKLDMIDDVEFIYRAILTGSGYEAYTNDGIVCGHRLPSGLYNGSRLPFPLDTPTSKAKVGHDQHIDAFSIRGKYPDASMILYQAFILAQYEAAQRGLLLLDTKFEGGVDPETGKFCIGDELLTFDSSRYAELAEFDAAAVKHKLPVSLDKQFVRNFGIEMGINKRNPEKSNDVAWVHNQVFPDSIIDRTAALCRYAFYRLSGQPLWTYQRDVLRVPAKAPRVVVVIGSESDKPQCETGLRYLADTIGRENVAWHVISAHRNPDDLRNFAQRRCGGADVVITGAGWFAALSGDLAGWINRFGYYIPVVGVGFQVSGDDQATIANNTAALLSASTLPGKPVILRENGSTYTDFYEACVRVVHTELPVPAASKQKVAQLDLPLPE